MQLIKKILLLITIITLTSCETQTNNDVDESTSKLENHINNTLCLNNKCPYKTNNKNIIIDHGIFILSYNPETKFADWVAYKILPENMHGKNKERVWKSDPKLSSEIALIPEDYKGAYQKCGTDRGHQTPLASFSNHEHAFKTNYLSNITPQKAKLNQGAWVRLEKKVRNLAKNNNSEVYVITGTYYKGDPICILPNARLKHRIPNGYWKIIAVKDGENVRYSSFSMPQETTNKDYCKYKTSIQKIKELTGISFPINHNQNNSLSDEIGCGN